MNPFDDLNRVSSYLDCASFCHSPHDSAHVFVRLRVEIPTDEALYDRLPVIRKELA
jgi:hypothetical protein